MLHTAALVLIIAVGTAALAAGIVALDIDLAVIRWRMQLAAAGHRWAVKHGWSIADGEGLSREAVLPVAIQAPPVPVMAVAEARPVETFDFGSEDESEGERWLAAAAAGRLSEYRSGRFDEIARESHAAA